MADTVAAPAADPTSSPAPAPAAPAPEPAPAPAPAAEPTPTPKTDWPDDWRTRVSGDEKHLKTLQRFASPKALFESYESLRQRMSSGELRSALPQNAKPEELAAWRKDNGIPESPDKYDLKIEVPAEDKAYIEGFLKSAHTANMHPDQAKAAVEWYYQEQEARTEARHQKDEEQRIETLDALNAEWGKDFRRNVNLITGLLSKFPAEVREALEGARLPDGRGAFNHPEVMRGFLALALENNPVGIVVPSGAGDMAQSVESEIAGIEKLLDQPRIAGKDHPYWSHPEVQKRYQDLLEAQSKLKQKAA